jgi:hypothetical protein
VKYICEEITANPVFHDLTFSAVRTDLIAVSEDGAAVFPVVQAHGSILENTHAFRPSLVYNIIKSSRFI